MSEQREESSEIKVQDRRFWADGDATCTQAKQVDVRGESKPPQQPDPVSTTQAADSDTSPGDLGTDTMAFQAEA